MQSQVSLSLAFCLQYSLALLQVFLQIVSIVAA
jgi:hypothetical protein